MASKYVSILKKILSFLTKMWGYAKPNSLLFRGGLSFDIINTTINLEFHCISWRPLRITNQNKSTKNKQLSIKQRYRSG